ncbi:hypothetical protein AC579_5564 [Pseudocercospora musae]|uniref:Uncharacterized protein n=1 Tax=Pseudocercospora musae TaxID=113226 RepID=A0A139I8Z6_9PEZI|nr:hypothetical protein AC579_5564 [Pseudocercospora musae]KXT11221.1 hypothetical protein AC579_5564 [Pseudocercospora musae]
MYAEPGEGAARTFISPKLVKSPMKAFAAAFSPGKTSIEKTDTRNDEPHDEATEDQVDIVIFEAGILSIHVYLQRIATTWLGRVELRLGGCQCLASSVALQSWSLTTTNSAIL